MATIRRITTGINTIPAYTAATGAITTSTSDTQALLYVGTDDLNSMFPPQEMYGDGNRWIYCATGGTNKLVRVTGLSQVDDTNFTIYIDRPMTGLSSAAFNYVEANLLGYSFTNDGNATGTANGVNIVEGETITDAQLAPANARTNFQDPVLIDATSTDFLVTENR